ncbi:unnamed protein product, partial [Ectocarpus sp. 12 AP-2014]
PNKHTPPTDADKLSSQLLCDLPSSTATCPLPPTARREIWSRRTIAPGPCGTEPTSLSSWRGSLSLRSELHAVGLFSGLVNSDADAIVPDPASCGRAVAVRSLPPGVPETPADVAGTGGGSGTAVSARSAVANVLEASRGS